EIGIVYGYAFDFGLREGIREVPDFDMDAILVWNFIDACAVFRREVWVECGGYDAALRALEDWELWINAARKGWQFHNLREVTFDYRVRPDSLITKVNNPEVLQELLSLIMTKHLHLYESRWIKDLAYFKAHLYEQAAHAVETERIIHMRDE